LIGNGAEEIFCERVISTLPPATLISCLLDTGVPENVINAAGNLKYNSIACVGIGVKGELNDISWLYVPQIELGQFNRISFPSNYSAEVAPKGCSSILAEITYNDGDEISKMSDSELIRHVTEGLMKMNIIKSESSVVYSDVSRFEYAYVVYDLDYLKNVKIMREYIESLGIDLVGRFSEFEYINMDGCIRHVMDYIKKTA
ncbi:MAG: FAD-dependent oxidoreductase, partial [Methanomicrobium sp.]|nr:FAD-dependent oxidoreductase [Methanomicrobium sp.]